MSISHWGIFPGFMTVGPAVMPGTYMAVWQPCDFDYFVNISCGSTEAQNTLGACGPCESATLRISDLPKLPAPHIMSPSEYNDAARNYMASKG